MSAWRIAQSTAADLPTVADLFRAYSASLPDARDHEAIADEVPRLPAEYGPPRGALLIARGEDDTPLGCVGMRPLEFDGVCEMKRLYVAPEGRGQGLGKALTLALIEAARERGYREMYLDTLSWMAPAIALYQSLGFTEIAQYYEDPIEGMLFMRLKL